jgi:hypothetical protein
MTSSMGVNPIVILLSLVTFSAVFGFPGALLALPLAAIIQMGLERIIQSANGYEPPVRPDELNLQALLGRSQEATRVITEAFYKDDRFPDKEAEPLYLEMTSISQELTEILRTIKSEEEA